MRGVAIFLPTNVFHPVVHKEQLQYNPVTSSSNDTTRCPVQQSRCSSIVTVCANITQKVSGARAEGGRRLASAPTSAEYMDCFVDVGSDRVMGDKLTSRGMSTAVCRQHCLDEDVDHMYYGTQVCVGIRTLFASLPVRFSLHRISCSHV